MSPRWSPRKRDTFIRLAPAAVCIAGTEGPVPRTFGDNRGAWPIRVGITERWEDTSTPGLNSGSPLWWQGVLFRVWTPSREHAKQLGAAVLELVAERVEQLRGAWVDLGPETDLALFEVEVYALAERLKIPARDDDALNKWLDWVLRKEMDRDERGR